MNINPLMTDIGRRMGMPTEQDLYNGPKDRFIVYAYEDERAAYYGDDDEEETAVTVQVQMITPREYDYHADKAKLKRLLKQKGFTVEHIQCWLDDAAAGTSMARRTIFTCHMAGAED